MSRTNRAVLTALTACIVVIGTLLAVTAGSGSTASAAGTASDIDALVVAAGEPGTEPSSDVNVDDRIERRIERRAEHRAERRAERRAVVYELLPDALQADIDAVKTAPEDQRHEMRAEIIRKALAGDYGDKVRAAAEKLQELRGR